MVFADDYTSINYVCASLNHTHLIHPQIIVYSTIIHCFMKGIIKLARFILKSQTSAWINLFRRLYFIVMFDTLFDCKVTSDSTLLPFFRVIASLFGKSTRFITGAHLNEEEKLYLPWKIQRNESDVNWAINLFRRKGSVKSSYVLVLVIYLASIKNYYFYIRFIQLSSSSSSTNNNNMSKFESCYLHLYTINTLWIDYITIFVSMIRQWYLT